jgi:hypothetical protein
VSAENRGLRLKNVVSSLRQNFSGTKDKMGEAVRAKAGRNYTRLAGSAGLFGLLGGHGDPFSDVCGVRFPARGGACLIPIRD